jgi:hypothetical protein
MSLSLWNRASHGTESKCLLKVYKAMIDFRRVASCLLSYGLECKDVINGLISRLKTNPSSSTKVFPLKLLRKLQMSVVV